MLELKTSDWLIAFCTLLGPILAVQAQKWIERARQRRDRKQWIFDTLMATRAMRLNPDHVRALNQIELEFSGSNWFGRQMPPSPKEKLVLQYWREYADILNETPSKTEADLLSWQRRGNDAFMTMLQAMGRALGHDFDRAELRRGIYYPQGFSDVEIKQRTALDALVAVFTGGQPLKMEVSSFPYDEAAAAKQGELYDRLIKALAEGAVRVDIKNDDRKPPAPFAKSHS